MCATNPFDPEIPFYHPCSTLLLDDDEDFVRSLRVVLGDKHAVLGYSSPAKALECIDGACAFADKAFNLFADHGYLAEGAGTATGDQMVLLKSSRLHDLAVYDDRYRIVSVVVVDEVMPGMRGLDFCRALKNTGIKTILLTGQMEDAAQTIEAFNSGVMDRFVSKKDPQALIKIKAMIEALHRSYFAERLAPFRVALGAAHAGPDGSQLSALMAEIHDHFPFREYYYHSRSGGYLLRDDSGQSRVCLLSDLDGLRGLADFVEDQAGPGELSEGLRRGDLVAWDFFDKVGDGRLLEDRIAQLLYPANRCGDIFWSLVPEENMPYADAFSCLSWSVYKEKVSASPLNTFGYAA